jgi:hypothetical protein
MAVSAKNFPYKFTQENQYKFDPSKAFTNVPQLNIAEQIPFSVIGMDLGTGRREINLQQPLPPTEPNDIYGGKGALGSPEEQLQVWEPFLRRQRGEQLAYAKAVSDLETQQQLGLTKQIYPIISKAAQEATLRNLGATFVYEEGSPKQRQARMQSAQAGEATMMQAIANQAQAAAAMRGRYQGKNVGIA